MDYSFTSVSAFPPPPSSTAESTKHVDLISRVTQNAINNTSLTRGSFPFVPSATPVSGFQTTLNRSRLIFPQDHKNQTENLLSTDTLSTN